LILTRGINHCIFAKHFQYILQLNYIIHAHKSPKQLRRLIERLSTSDTNFYIHIDRSTDLQPFRDELASIDTVYLFDDDQRIAITWGDVSQVEATLLAIQKIIADKRQGYCILMSGQDYPIKSNQDIGSFFEANKGKNFISGLPLYTDETWSEGLSRIEKYNFHPHVNKRTRIIIPSIYDSDFYTLSTLRNINTLIKTKERKRIPVIFHNRYFPRNLTAITGSGWWALPMETISMIHTFMQENPSYLTYHRFTHSADETFFHSIVFSNINNKLICDGVTYVNWTRKDCQLPVTFCEKDFEELSINNDNLFARKFDASVDSAILNRIDSEILTR